MRLGSAQPDDTPERLPEYLDRPARIEKYGFSRMKGGSASRGFWCRTCRMTWDPAYVRGEKTHQSKGQEQGGLRPASKAERIAFYGGKKTTKHSCPQCGGRLTSTAH